MVDINLIPPALRKDKEGPSLAVNLRRDVLLGVGFGVVFLLVAVHAALGFAWWIAQSESAGSNGQWQKLQPDKTTIDAIHTESKNLSQKIKALSAIIEKKSWWAPKFNAISDALPKGLWVRKMTFDRNGGLVMEGSVVSKTQNEINNVGLFISTLKQNADFMKDFSSLEVNSIQRGKMDGVDVTDFTAVAKPNAPSGKGTAAK